VIHQRALLRRLMSAGAALALAVGLAACQSAHAGTPEPGRSPVTSTATVPAAQVLTVPVDGVRDVRPDAPVSVTVAHGTVADVTVTSADGASVPGQVAAVGAGWLSDGPLEPATTYTVTARAADAAGGSTTSTSTFTTLTPQRTLEATILPRDGWTVGVGMPVIVEFDTAVQDRAAVERRLSVTTTPQLDGAWRWLSDRQVQWRPRDFWPAGTQATVTADLPGVEAAPGTWGGAARSASFEVGSAMVSTVDIANHTMTVRKDGQVLRTIPITTGKRGYETRNGTKVIISRETEHRMDAASLGTDKNDPEYYNVLVKYAMRLTWSGEFIHAAPWSVAQQGRAAVSHGCTGMSTEDAKWLFERSKVGDVVTFVGGNRSLEWGNGYTAWEMSFDQWAKGSAL
jgi:lipoprotein-anchoring transpeptidase ErfK/SrfK